jgi:hypothetical protein
MASYPGNENKELHPSIWGGRILGFGKGCSAKARLTLSLKAGGGNYVPVLDIPGSWASSVLFEFMWWWGGIR